MPVPVDTLWEIEPHTIAKHEILRRYLGAWFGIMGQTNRRIIYLDGFCGPGRYKKGEDGSPIIALKIALEHNSHQRIGEASFIFIDEKQDRVLHLEDEIRLLNTPHNFHVSTFFNQFENTLNDILDSLEAKGAKLAPTFAFIDPFGFKGAPYKLVQRLLQNSKTEIFINIMADSINRFLEHPNPQITHHIIELFGTTEVLQIINSSGDRIDQLKQLYQEQLSKNAKYVRFFEMRDENNRPIYYLFFATNNRLGHVKMKEAFWKVDHASGYKFSDATNPHQLVLFEDDPSKDLAEQLSCRYSKKKVVVLSIKTYVEDETPFTTSHMKKALCSLEEQDRICVEPCKQNGAKRVTHTFPDDVIVSF